MFNRFLPFLAALALGSAALAQQLPLLPDDEVSAQIAEIDVGVICAQEIVGFNDAPGTIAGTTNVIEGEPEFISRARVVPAVMGVGFGVKSRSANPFGLDGVVMTVTHPPMGTDGATQQVYNTAIRGTARSITFYQFDYNYELLVGRWEMEASLNGEVLYRVGFDVVPPTVVPELAGACGFEDLLS